MTKDMLETTVAFRDWGGRSEFSGGTSGEASVWQIIVEVATGS